jgi:hypothetical protein
LIPFFMLIKFIDNFSNKHYNITNTLKKLQKKLQNYISKLCKIKGKYTHGRV